MLRMMLLGLLIPLGVGALAAMELRTPPRNTVAVVQPPAETPAIISDSHAVLAKADRLDVAYAASETPATPALVDEPVVPPKAKTIEASEAPKVNKRPRSDPRPKKVTTAGPPKPRPKTTEINRTAHSGRTKAAASDNPLCRLSAFGGLRKALNTVGCEL